MQYPIFIHKDAKSDYGVIIPDLPGCFSAGSTIEETLLNAREAIECHLEGLLMDGESIPLQMPIENHLKNPDLEGSMIAVVDVDLSKISGKSKRINITVPARFLKQIDAYTRQHGGNRSAFLMDAAIEYLAQHR